MEDDAKGLGNKVLVINDRTLFAANRGVLPRGARRGITFSRRTGPDPVKRSDSGPLPLFPLSPE